MKASVYGFVASGVAIEKSDDKPSPNLSYVTHFVPQLTLTAPRASISGISQSLASCGTSHPLSQRRRVARSHEGAGNRGSCAKGTQGHSLLPRHLSCTSKRDPKLSWFFLMPGKRGVRKNQSEESYFFSSSISRTVMSDSLQPQGL